MTHALDHLVLPTRDLDTARARLEALGFTVSPVGVHPFGTINCCVYFQDGTFMEPLAVGDAEMARQAIAGGNVFVARDHTFRRRNGEEGFSAVVFGTGDADADHARYVAEGISAGGRLDFSRPFTDAAGREDIASFRLAFAAASDMSDAFVFACERANAPKVDRAALQAHANGTSAIREVIAVSDDPRARLAMLALASGTSVARDGDILDLGNARLTLLDTETFQARLGVAVEPSPLRFAAVAFAGADIDVLSQRLAATGIDHHLRGETLVVPAAAGQGAAFIFEDRA